METKLIGLISLGCDKNRVDAEKCLAIVNKKYKVTNDVEKANVIIINSCAFLESARKEALDTVFEINELRNNGNLEKIVLSGCLSQKYHKEIFDELTEIDLFVGFLDYDLLIDGLDRCYSTGERVDYTEKCKTFYTKERVLTTPGHYAYLKIADGCDNFCTYCLIPKIRGRYFSYDESKLIEEAEFLGDTEELILVAQDITRYGIDLFGKPMIVDLIQKLSKLDNIHSIRLLYCYPDMLSNELINEIKTNDKVIKYVDIPLQHSENKVLKRMNRKGTREEYLELINKLKTEIPSIAIRSTFIAGFPGETEEDFNGLLDFIEKARLTNCGFFAYSREEDTPSYNYDNQISERIKNSRVKKLYDKQKKISKEILSQYIGKEIDVICDGIDYDKGMFYGRAYFQCPDIDGKVYLSSKDDIMQGEKYKVLVKKTDAYDIYGEIL